MRPAHIQVFDGLRITTEHIEHLQGALHSAVRDVREILGLGKVYRGFEVAASGNRAVVVQPGLAFDAQNNRLVSDEPKTLEVTFAPEETTKYVCLKYAQVGTGEVEEQATLIWDSCTLELRSALPEPRDNLLPIARLDRAADTFAILPLPLPEPEKTDEEPTAAEPESEVAANAAETPAESAAEPITPPPTEVIAPPPNPGRLQVRQGVTRLASAPEAVRTLKELLGDALQSRLSSPPTDAAEVSVTLAEQEVASAFPVSSLTCQTLFSGSLAASETSAPPPVETAERPGCAAASGEVTFTPTEISQFGVVTLHSAPYAANGAAWRPVELIENGIGHLPLSLLWKPPESGDSGTIPEALSSLWLRVRIENAAQSGFKITGSLRWQGSVTDDSLRQLESLSLRFTWEVLVAWKTLGELPG